MDTLASRLIDQFTSEIVAIPFALLLVAATFLVLPRPERRRARQSAVLLGLSVVCGLSRFILPAEAAAHRGLLFGATFFLLASIGRSVVLLLVHFLFDRKRERPAPRIFRDLSTGVTYLFVALVAMRAIGVEPGSILTTSALLTAVVGLSLQDTLGNLVSGLALQMQRPFDVGDWIEIDNGAQAGQVTECTWRATSIMTLDRVEVILPNAGLAKAAIRNYSRPSKVSRRRLAVGVAYGSPPSEVHKVLVSAAVGSPGVLATPPPRARTKAFADSAVTHELLYFIDDFEHALDTDGEVLDRVYHGLARRGFDIPFPTRTLRTVPVDDGTERREVHRERMAATMATVDLLKPLPDDSRQLLLERATLHRYGPGEPVVRKGDPSMAMFIVETGRLAVEVPRDGGNAAEVAALGDRPGQDALRSDRHRPRHLPRRPGGAPGDRRAHGRPARVATSGPGGRRREHRARAGDGRAAAAAHQQDPRLLQAGVITA
jgi:small-conductance mechanosensitive channel